MQRVPDEEQARYIEILEDPSAYAEYQRIMSQPNYAEEMNSELVRAYAAEQTQEKGGELTDLKANIKDELSDPEKRKDLELWLDWMKEPEKYPELQAQFEALEKQRGGKKQNMTLLEKHFDDPKYDARKKELDIAEEEKYAPFSIVAPKWVKLSQGPLTEEERIAEEEWKRKKKRILDPPGGDEALRQKPRSWGRRMGIRVPIVCSPM